MNSDYNLEVTESEAMAIIFILSQNENESFNGSSPSVNYGKLMDKLNDQVSEQIDKNIQEEIDQIKE